MPVRSFASNSLTACSTKAVKVLPVFAATSFACRDSASFMRMVVRMIQEYASDIHMSNGPPVPDCGLPAQLRQITSVAFIGPDVFAEEVDFAFAFDAPDGAFDRIDRAVKAVLAEQLHRARDRDRRAD